MSLAWAAVSVKFAPEVLQHGGPVGRAAARPRSRVAMSASLPWIAWNLRDRLAEGLALLGVGQRLVERALGQADAHRRDADPADVEDVEELLEAGAARAEQVLLGDAGSRRTSAAACRRRSSPSCGRARPARSRACRSGTIRFEISPSPVRAVIATMAGDVGARVGDELLGAVDHPLAVVQRGARADVAGVRAGLGLGQAEGAELLAGQQSRAATRPSAPRSRTGRSAGCRARCGRTA